MSDDPSPDHSNSPTRPARHSAFNPKPAIPEPPFPTEFKFPNGELADVLREMQFGVGIAEQDNLLYDARIETTAFTDLWRDRVDIIPGTKGSGKSALFRIFVDYIEGRLIDSQGVILASGITRTGDPVFNAYKNEFESFSELDFQTFWSVYLVALAHIQLMTRRRFDANPRLKNAANNAKKSFDVFNKQCVAGKIPLADPKPGFLALMKNAIDWVKGQFPEITYELPEGGGSVTVKLGTNTGNQTNSLPVYLAALRDSMDTLLADSGLKLWFMIDRLDEVFPRRTDVERLAMRGLLRTAAMFGTSNIRVKLFIRDDMLREVTAGSDGFTALTHITARKAARLYWTEEQLLDLIVRRVCLTPRVVRLLGADSKRLENDSGYRTKVFYAIFPKIVDGGTHGSPTMRWIFNHLADAQGVVTPRDVIRLLDEARQFQQNQCNLAKQESSESIFDRKALKHALAEVSKVKCETYLYAEFPHLADKIRKLESGKTQLDADACSKLFGKKCEQTVEDLVAIGLLKVEKTKKETRWKIPFVYRAGLKLTQGAHNGD